jgi:WD40 repeat protein
VNHLARPPLALDLELVRAAESDRPHGVAAGQWNRYLLRDPDGSGRYEDGALSWDEDMAAALAATADAASAGEAVARLGAAMGAFIASAGWARVSARIQQARAAGRAVCITLRAAAHELYTLPWELLDIGGTPLYRTDDCLLRHQPPGPAGAPPAPPPACSARVLVAWSGAVPAAEHIEAIAAAARAGHVELDRARDVLAHASVDGLGRALRERPTTILHLLCHGQALPGGQAYGLMLDGASQPVPPDEIGALLAPHAGSLRLVVLAACLGSNAGAVDNALGSVAQAIIAAGVPAVVAARHPLSTAGSTRVGRALYRRLLADLWSLERAFLEARAALRGQDEPGDLDAVALQLHTGPTESLDFRPCIIRPYRGLRAYDCEDTRLFFGREEETALLVQRVAGMIERGAPRFLLVAGASGTGKSSLVRAGLLGALAQGEAPWATAVMRPGEGATPAERLARCLEPHRGAGARLALVVDQLEELFTEVAEAGQREAFLRELWRLARDPAAGVLVIATIRIEYLGRLGTVRMDETGAAFDRELLDSERCYLVRQLGPEQYERIIRGPAGAAGLLIAPGLLDRLLHALRAEPGALPLLSYTLDELWQRRSFEKHEVDWSCVTGQREVEGDRAGVAGWWLTDQAYDALGGAGPGGIEGVLAGAAEAIHARLAPEHQAELRRVLVQLVHGHDDLMLATRRRGWREALRPGPAAAAVFDHVVGALVEARLLVQGSDGPDDPVWIELAHDALIRVWPRLHQWYAEARSWLVLAGELRAMAAAWQPHARTGDSAEARAREESYLPLRGQRLSYHLEAWGRYRHHLGAAEQRLGQAFLAACKRAEDRRIEAARRRTRITSLVAVVVAAVMTVLGVWARKQQLEAEEQRGKAEELRAIAMEGETTARDALLMASARELLGRNQPAWAAKLLEAIARPGDIPGWRVLGLEVLSQTRLVATLRGHEQAILDVAISADGALVATASQDGTARVWRVDGAGEPLVLRHEAGVSAVVFGPDGTFVATASQDGTARVWRVDGAGEPLVLRHEAAVYALDVSPGGELVVTASDDRTARLWRVRDGSEVAILRAHDAAVSVARFSPDGAVVLTAGMDGKAHLWQVDDPAQVTALTGHQGPILCGDFDRSGNFVATGAMDGTARVWQVHAPSGSGLLDNPGGGVTSVSFNTSGQYLMTASIDDTVRVWNLAERGRFDAVDTHTAIASFAAFSPDGERFVTAFRDGAVHLWDATGEKTVLAGHEDQVSAAAFSRDGRRLVTVSADRTARVWQAGNLDRFYTTLGRTVSRQAKAFNAAAFTGHGAHVLAVASDSTAQVWRADGSALIAALGGGDRRISVAEPSPDGTHVATFSYDGVLRLWQVQDASERAAVRAHEARINTVRFSPDGAFIVTASADGSARIWRAGDLAPVTSLQAHEGTVTSATFSPDGARVLTTSADGAARIWRVADLAPATVLRAPTGKIVSAVFSPDGALVATSSARETCIWSVEDPAAPVILGQFPSDDTPPLFSRDGALVLTARRSVAQVRRARDPQEVIDLRHDTRILATAFSPDGRLVAAVGNDGRGRLWSLDAPEQSVLLDGQPLIEPQFSRDGKLLLARRVSDVHVWPVSVEGLLASLQRAGNDCLTPPMRRRYMGEREADATSRYEDCERRHGRVPQQRAPGAAAQP